MHTIYHEERTPISCLATIARVVKRVGGGNAEEPDGKPSTPSIWCLWSCSCHNAPCRLQLDRCISRLAQLQRWDAWASDHLMVCFERSVTMAVVYSSYLREQPPTAQLATYLCVVWIALSCIRPLRGPSSEKACHSGSGAAMGGYWCLATTSIRIILTRSHRIGNRYSMVQQKIAFLA
jgi:hypothetical protein